MCVFKHICNYNKEKEGVNFKTDNMWVMQGARGWREALDKGNYVIIV